MPGTVHVPKHWNSEETAILHLDFVCYCQEGSYSIPTIIKPAGVTAEQKQYLYDETQQFITPKYQDITCPSP